MEDFFLDFEQQNADFAVASIPYNVQIPYAILETDETLISSLREKPFYTYFANAGIYLLRTSLLQLLKKNEFSNATDFVELLIKQGYKVICHHFHGYWLDIGKPDDFKKANEDAKHIRFTK
jgi:NDP-sugar pyrophosphorylase family protein